VLDKLVLEPFAHSLRSGQALLKGKLREASALYAVALQALSSYYTLQLAHHIL